MKTKLIFLLSLLWILIGCDDSDSATLNISESKFDNISASGESLTIDITCSSSWTVTSNKQWCIPSTQKFRLRVMTYLQAEFSFSTLSAMYQG